ncbi:hypothetical protein AOQ84DRAFT_219394 [Glonium stellatum]|uniref:Uncharacterized protein n=1 Tax=Glonium stellatum TaxID=574774 RepID=A0A8E2EMN8_9PEZI|nr:hypothetical protein AOQ84DRAFT_219394 [Glonium stellatum]
MNASDSLMHNQNHEQEPYCDDPPEPVPDHGTSVRHSLSTQYQDGLSLPSEPQKHSDGPSATRPRPQRYRAGSATIYPPPHPASSAIQLNGNPIAPSLPSDAPPSYNAAVAAAYNDTLISRIPPSSHSYYPPNHPARTEGEDEYGELIDHTSFKVERWVARIIVLTAICIAGLIVLFLAQNGMLW